MHTVAGALVVGEKDGVISKHDEFGVGCVAIGEASRDASVAPGAALVEAVLHIHGPVQFKSTQYLPVRETYHPTIDSTGLDQAKGRSAPGDTGVVMVVGSGRSELTYQERQSEYSDIRPTERNCIFRQGGDLREL